MEASSGLSSEVQSILNLRFCFPQATGRILNHLNRQFNTDFNNNLYGADTAPNPVLNAINFCQIRDGRINQITR
jgi:hypothetical protein